MEKILLPVLIIFILITFFPKIVRAEIATTWDWIGFFATNQPGNSKSDTVNGNSWAYTYNCSQANPPLTAIPKLADPTGCNFTFNPPPPDNSYQFRLYANDQQTSDALIATSKTIYVGPSPSPTPQPIPGKLYNVSGNLILDSNITVSEIGMIFVDGNLSINTNLTHNNNNAGLVFVVKGDVAIAPSVTQVDAVLISSGIIYTAGAGCSHNSPVNTSQLIINGSLVSLDGSKNIEFCRTLESGNRTTPAERINQQPKYLVILRDLYSETLQKWSEIQ